MSTATLTKPTTREVEIEQLLNIRDIAAHTIAAMPAHKRNTYQAWDRDRDVDFAEDLLARLGAE